MFALRRLGTAAALAAALLAGGVGAVSARQTQAPPTVEYLVGRGDTLWGIAGRVTRGDRRKAIDRIMRLNRLRTPSLEPGQVLRLPSR